MASFIDDVDDIRRNRKVTITGTDHIENYTIYNIEVSVCDCQWSTRHRYSEFADLHEKLVIQHKVEKGLLPPKKLLGNLSRSFIEKRQKDLEQYLHSLLQRFIYLPKSLSYFLGFNKYEIHGVVEALAEELFEKGDMILSAGEVYHMTPIQLYAITERLKLALPTCESGDRRRDLGHVMDFIARLKYLKITGFDGALGTSSRTVNELPFDMSIFKALIQVQKLMPRVEYLDLSYNQIVSVDHLQNLSCLTHVDLSHNELECVDAFNTKFGNIKSLNLAGNRIESISGLAKLYSLVHLDVSHNKIEEVIEIKHLKGLPCLEKIFFLSNPVTIVTDYRTKVLEVFNDRASEITLDGQITSQKELDTVAVLQAIHKAREAKGKQGKNSPKKKHTTHVHAAEIAEANDDSDSSSQYQQYSFQGSASSTPPSTGQVTEGTSPIDSEFRSQIETIRNIGGEGWLRMLNEIQSPEKPSSSTTSQNQQGTPHVAEKMGRAEGGHGTMNAHQSLKQAVMEEIADGKNADSRSMNSFDQTDKDGCGQGIPLPASQQQFLCILESISKHSQADEFPIEDLLLTRIPIPPGEYCNSLDNSGEMEGEDSRQPPEGESDTSEAEATPSEDRARAALGDVSVKMGVVEKFREHLEKRLQTLMPGALFEVMNSARERITPQSSLRVTFKAGSTEEIAVTSEAAICLPAPLPVPVIDPVRIYSEEALNELSNYNAKANLRVPDAMKSLASLRGLALVKYYHENIAQISSDLEELKFIMWCGVIPHSTPTNEVVTCVMLSSRALYFVSDEEVELWRNQPTSVTDSWKCHRRMHSDSILEHMQRAAKGRSKSSGGRHEGTSHSSGVIMDVSPDSSQGQVRCFHVLQLNNLKQVFIGMFDQSLRLTGPDTANTLACITRDYHLTHGFLDALMAALCFVNIATPSPEMERSASDFEVYSASAKARSCSENLEFVHPSKVRFVYPNEEVVSDLTFTIIDSIKEYDPVNDVTILMYSLLFQVSPCEEECDESSKLPSTSITSRLLEPRTLIVTNSHVMICLQDHVSYPLPDFAKILPENAQYKVLEAKRLTDLRRVVISDFGARDIALVFEKTEVVVDVTRDYYSARDSPITDEAGQQEIQWTFILQTVEERERLTKLLSKQWTNITSKELSVQINT
uniref:Nischarin-like n=1 Tax=Saccoglossus kowalevskii TaxID=10224 RepID=A0ABM0MMR9_SACKO|nr:PREDICTED: nischarin-like [Saccoglossus kowalevskii]